MIPEEIKESEIVVDKNSNYNIAKGILSYKDLQKLLAMNKTLVKPLPPIGSTISPSPDQHLRRQKIKYSHHHD